MGFLSIHQPRGLESLTELSKDDIRLILDREAKIAYSSKTLTCIIGFIAGVAVFLVPVWFLGFNALIGLFSGVYGAGLGRIWLSTLLTSKFFFGALASGLAGVVSALARRWSGQTGRYWWLYLETGQIRFGLDDMLSLIAGPVVLTIALRIAGASTVMYLLLALSPMPAFVIHSMWELFYCPIMYRLGRVTDIERIKVSLLDLKQHPTLRAYHPICSFDQRDGTVHITIDAQDASAEEWVQRAVMQSNLMYLGVKQIHVDRIAQ